MNIYIYIYIVGKICGEIKFKAEMKFKAENVFMLDVCFLWNGLGDTRGQLYLCGNLSLGVHFFIADYFRLV